MTSRPFILITNDDGITAPGIRHLFNALKKDADLIVVAPSHERSACGMSTTLRDPLKIEKVVWGEDGEAFSISGTPADCVKLALSVISQRKPDIIVSGVNRGSNAGRNVLYSGTISAVIEGVLRDVPGIAFSCYDFQDPIYAMTEKYIPQLVNYVLSHKLPEGTLLNVNFPSKTFEKFLGIKMVRQGKEYWIENPDHRSHPGEGHSYWWLGSKIAEYEEHEESDIMWLKKGYITAVPVYVGELTHNVVLEERKHLFEKFFQEI